jgi:hypothetical protein
MDWIGAGYFEDEYTKEGDQWKFAARQHSLDGIDYKTPLRIFM